MKFFIDSANLGEIESADQLGILDGVTTNPSLIAKEGLKAKKQIYDRYVDICNLVEGDVSAEVLSTDYPDMVKEGYELSILHPQIVVKVPCTRDGIRAIRYFNDNGIRTNCTLVFTTGQALLAAKAGATHVSPFVGRLDDIACDGISLVSKIVRIYGFYSYNSQVLAASIRSTQHVIQCMEAGADVVTCPLAIIESLFSHPLTEAGIEKFSSDSLGVE